MTSFKQFLAFRWLTLRKRWNDTWIQRLCDDELIFRCVPAEHFNVNLMGQAVSRQVSLKSHSVMLLLVLMNWHPLLYLTSLIHWSQQYLSALPGKWFSFYFKMRCSLELPLPLQKGLSVQDNMVRWTQLGWFTSEIVNDALRHEFPSTDFMWTTFFYPKRNFVNKVGGRKS